jgi:hypothetical protein
MTYNQELTTRFKQIILELGLYKTGALYDSIMVYTNVNENEISIDLFAKFYLKYLWEKYSIESAFTFDPTTTLEFTKLVQTYIEQQVQKILQGEDADIEDVSLTFNLVDID